MGTLLKRLALGIAIMVGCISLTMNVVEFEPAKQEIYIITDFTIEALTHFIVSTEHLTAGDTLKILSVGHGGNAMNCMGMVNHIEYLQSVGVHIITEVQGYAYSANAIIWIAGDERRIHRHDLVMFHLAYMRTGLVGVRLTISQMTPLQRMILNHLNDYLIFKLTRVIRDTEIVINMTDDPDNWYKGIDLYRIGVATKLIEN